MVSTHDNEMYSQQDKKILLQLAGDSIQYGLKQGGPLPVDLKKFQGELLQKRATFVTLTINTELKGCVGMLEAVRPLVVDVVENAYAAAFLDSRFSPLTEAEAKKTAIAISVLSIPEPLQFVDEEDLLNQIRVGIDGLILKEGHRRGTFLPSVWEQVTGKKEFLNHLKLKAGLPEDYWSRTLRVARYTTESIK